MTERYSSTDHPLVSVIIPTRERPDLLTGAVRSALRQSWPKLEVVVVIDGPDRQTQARMDKLNDPRVRMVMLQDRAGGSAARNAGVRAARGEWIAFLDDDDAWVAEKIQRQMAAVRQSGAWFPVISCRLIARSPSVSRLLPPRIYDQRESVGDFLFCRTGFRDSGGMIQTSTLLAPRDLLLALPFREDLAMHQDWDWIIRISSHQGVGITMLSEPLTIWRVNDARATVGRNIDWLYSLSWIRQQKRLVSPRAFSSFIAIQCAWRARQSHTGFASWLRLLRAWYMEGQPDWLSLAHFLYFGLTSAGIRGRIRERFVQDADRPGSAPGLFLVSSRKATSAALRRTSS